MFCCVLQCLVYSRMWLERHSWRQEVRHRNSSRHSLVSSFLLYFYDGPSVIVHSVKYWLGPVQNHLGFFEIQAELTNFSILPNIFPNLPIKIFKFYFILEYFNFKLTTFWAQSNVFGVKSKCFSKIRQIRLFRQGISENLV